MHHPCVRISGARVHRRLNSKRRYIEVRHDRVLAAVLPIESVAVVRDRVRHAVAVIVVAKIVIARMAEAERVA